jgi:hypothetical protein
LKELTAQVKGKGAAVLDNNPSFKTEGFVESNSETCDIPSDGSDDESSWQTFDQQAQVESTLADIDESGDYAPSFFEKEVQSSDSEIENDEWDQYVVNNPIDYEASDSEEVENEHSDFDFERDKQLYPNVKSTGFSSSEDDSYSGLVMRWKSSTSPERFARFEKREILANKHEQEIFGTPRTKEDLQRASQVETTEKRLKNKLWRHPGFFGLEAAPKERISPQPKVNFYYKYGSTARAELKDHFLSSDTRCFPNVEYRDQQNSQFVI